MHTPPMEDELANYCDHTNPMMTTDERIIEEYIKNEVEPLYHDST